MRYFFIVVMVLVAAIAAAAALPGASAEASVTLRPSYMDAVRFSPASGTIHIETDKPGLYKVTITGVPAEWLDYQESVRIDGSSEDIGYVVNPLSTGKYTLTITVKGPGGTLAQEQALWVGYPGSAGAGDYASAPEFTSDGQGAVTGMFSLQEGDVAIASYAAVALAAAITVLLGYAVLREETQGARGN